MIQKIAIGFLCLIVFFNVESAESAVLAIIDSGVDNNRSELKEKFWYNPREENNGHDDDGNSYIDDLLGWNFYDNNNEIIDYKYLGTFSDFPSKFFELQVKMMDHTINVAEYRWLKNQLNDPSVRKELGIFSNFVHGTHVAGIAAGNNPATKIIAVKIIPTEEGETTNSLIQLKTDLLKTMRNSGRNSIYAAENNIDWQEFEKMINNVTKEHMAQLISVGNFLKGHLAQVANGSFGTGYDQVKIMLEPAVNEWLERKATAAEIDRATQIFFTSLLKRGQKFVGASTKTLFVFAAGNDGSNNDLYPTSPTNIKADNTISVAATYHDQALAAFSNYGKLTVDVAAPGVGIESLIPGTGKIKMNGTSQAAPLVARAAAALFDTNPNLSPAEVKQIILSTVDKKAFLADKVKSSGVLNMPRALRAAELSLSYDLNRAITLASNEIKDLVAAPMTRTINKGNFQTGPIPPLETIALPLPSPLR